MKIQYDKYSRIEPAQAYLAKPNGKRLCALNGIDIETVNFQGNVNDISTLSITINKYVQNNNGELITSNGYDLVAKFMKIFVTNIGWFVMDTPSVHNSGMKEYKTIEAKSAQIEYNQVSLDTWKVNCGTTDSLEMMVDGNVEEIEGVEFAKQNIKFCNEENHALSLVHILTDKVPGWKVGYIDNIPKTYETLENGITTTKSVYLRDEVGKFDISYMSCYSFMTQDFEKYFNVIVDFDYLDKVINFYRVENFGKDTNISIGFRNVENSNDITIDEENIFTKYRVSGADGLGIEQINGGENSLFFLDEYWLNEKYLLPSTIKKYKAWYEYCLEARKRYADLSIQWVELQEIITELYNRLPLSDCDQNWNEYNDDDLFIVKSNYEVQRDYYEKIYSDIDGNLDIDALNASEDADTYYQIIDVILPNIEIEISNRNLNSSVDMEEYIKSYETNWKLYGIYELEAKLASYRDIISLLQKDHFDLSFEEYSALSGSDSAKYSPHTAEGHTSSHNEYLKSSMQIDESNIDSCAYALAKRKAEAKAEEDKQSVIQERRIALGKTMAIETWVDPNLGGFARTELDDLFLLVNPTTYQNENIFVSSTDSAIDKITIQQKLFETALDDLQVYSIPQTICTMSLDNIFSASGSELHAHDLDYGNFIRVEIRDGYFTKLRVTGISFNPFLYDKEFSFKFSNMIRSCSKRNDFVSMLNIGGNLTNSSANTSYNNNNQLTDDNIYSILQKIMSRYGFTSSGQVGVGGDTITAGILENEMIKTIDLTADNGFFQYLQAQLISAGKIVADDATFKKLQTFVANIDNLLAGNIVAELGHLIHLTAENVNIDEAVIKELIAANITVAMLKAGDISSDSFHITSDDGAFVIAGNTMQFKDKNDIVRIQIGRDSQNNFSFTLYDETGNGVLIDSDGVKKSAIADGLIVNDMIADKTVSKDKLGFKVVETDENGKVSITEILDPNGNSLGVTITQIQESVTQLGEEINTSGAYYISLDNEYQNIPCVNGVAKNNFLIDIPFTAYKGTSQVPSMVSVGLLPSGVTLGKITQSTENSQGKIALNVSKDANFGDSSVLTGYIPLTFSIDETTITKRFSWSKTNDGTMGDILIYALDASVTVIKKLDNSTLIPSAVDFSAYVYTSETSVKETYQGCFVVQESTDGVTFSNTYLSEKNENHITYVPTSQNVQLIRCSLYEANDIVKCLDVKTILIVTDAEHVSGEITEIQKSIITIEDIVDKNTQEIKNKVTQSDIITAINNYDASSVKTIRDEVAEHKVGIGQIQSTVKNVEDTLITKADGTTVKELSEKVTAIEQDANGFKQTVSDKYATKDSLKDYATTTQMNSAITQSATSIKSEVSEKYESKEHATNQYSLIEQRAGKIESTVTDVEGIANTANAATQENAKNISLVKQTAKAVETEVRDACGTSTLSVKLKEITTKVSDAEKGYSELSQTAGIIQQNISSMNGKLNSITSTAEGLKTRISNTEKEITDITATANKISTSVSNLEENTSTKFKQTEKDFSAMIQGLQDSLNNTIYKNFNFDANGLTISSSDSNITLRVDNTGINFYSGESLVASINSNKLHIVDATIVDNLQIGAFGYTKKSNGSLSFGKL